MLSKIMNSYPLQVFRHRIYLPYVAMLGYFGDFKRGVVSQQIIELNELGIDSSVGTRFETISYSKLQRILVFAKKSGYEKFMDIGCGLGRSLIVANEVGFTELYGIDVSEKLVWRCQRNMSKVGALACLSCIDVADIDLPDGKLVIYLFNPFGEERMNGLVQKLARREEESLVIYHNPKHFNCFGKMEIIKTFTWKHFGLFEEKAFVYLIPGKTNK